MVKKIIAFDIGGTSLKSGIVNSKRIVDDATLRYDEAKASSTAEEIVEQLVSIIKNHILNFNQDDCLKDIGFAFPGPFDYEKGISYMKGIDKYDSLYEYPLKKNLHEKIMELKRIDKKYSCISDNLDITFINDGTAFALGEYSRLATNFNTKMMVITLGTGCGSSFIDSGIIVRNKGKIPESGMIFAEPFKESIIDDYVSKRGVIKIAKQHKFDEKVDIAYLNEMASQGNTKAKDVFNEVGTVMGQAFKQYIEEFKPDYLVFGGGISKAFCLMEESFKEVLKDSNIEIIISEQLSKSAICGVASYIIDRRNGNV